MILILVLKKGPLIGNHDQSQVRHWALAILVLISATWNSGVQADIIYEEVRVRHVASSENKAISRALVEAIGRVNGKTMSASQAASSAVAQIGRSSETSSSFQTSVKQSTMGVVNRYELVSSAQKQRGWEVELDVEVAKLQKDDGKITLTLLPVFTGSEFRSDTAMLEKSLASFLVASRKFSIVEKDASIESQELIADVIQNPLVSEAERVLMLNQSPVDMYVEIEVLGKDFSYRTVQLPNFPPMSIPQGSYVVNYRVLDVFTQKVKFQDFLNLNIGPESFDGYSQVQLNNQIDSVIAEIAAKKMSAKILDAIYPMLLINVDINGVASINYGDDRLAEGERLAIFERGDVLVDPYTEEVLGWSERKISELTIDRTTPRLSFGSIHENINLIQSGFAEKRYVLKQIQMKQSDRLQDRRESTRDRINRRF